MARKTVTEKDNTLQEVQTALEKVTFELENVKMDDDQRRYMLEQMSSYSMTMDDRGWTPILGGSIGDDGPSLDDVKDDHSKISGLIAKQSWIKRGLSLRHSYVWKDGIKYAQLTDTGASSTTDKRTKGARVQGYIDLPVNQKNFFGPSARQQREAALYAGGIVLYMADDTTHTLKALPLSQITADYRNPDDPSEIWAYRRQWASYAPGQTTPGVKVEWYFHDVYFDKKQPRIENGGKSEKVNQTTRLFGGTVNSQQGWGYGVADASAAVPWLKLYRDFLINGYTVTQAMAQIWATAKQSSKVGADNAAMAVNGGGAGRVAVIGQANELTPLSTAGNAYSFDKGIQLAAAAASAIEISAIALLSDTSAAGGSYGSAQTLDLPTRLAMESRRAFHVNLDTAVLKWMGSKDPKVYFNPYTDETSQYRLVQAAVLAWSTGVYTAEQMLDIIDDIFGIKTDDKMPPGVLVPNTKSAIAAATPASTTNLNDATASAGTQVGGAGQGKNSGTGDATGGNDQRTDTISK